MAALTEEVKVYIITALACFDETKQVIADVKEKFGVTVYQQQLTAYDPSTVAGGRMSKRFQELFAKTRKDFLENISAVPIANAAVRLRKLQRLVTSAEARGNVKLVAELLEQAAKDSGGAFSNRQKVEASGIVGHMSVPAPTGAAVDPSEAYKKMMGGAR